VLAEALAVQAGEPVLVHGASGVTGGLIVSLAALRGATVIATASPSNHDRLRTREAFHVIDYHDVAWPEHVRDAAGGDGVAFAANAVRGGAADAIRAVRAGRSYCHDHLGSPRRAARHPHLLGLRAS
jgi:NADPH:quinone reductase-like Zn-dependent oxidoreductase